MKMKKELGTLAVFCISSGAMLSSGLFVLPGLAHAQAGPAVLIAYLLAAVFSIAGLLSQAELATAMPKTGGTYFYVMRSMGPGVGTAYGLITLFALALKSAFALVGLGFVVQVFAAHYDVSISATLVAAVLGLILIGINAAGAKEVIRIQIVLVIAIFAILIAFIGKGMGEVKVNRFEPFSPGGLDAVFAMAGFVFVSYAGPLKAVSVAGEVKDPGRSLPRGMVLSLLFVTTIHLLVVFVLNGILDGKVLDQSLTPVSDGAEAILGWVGWEILSLAAVLAFASAANAGIMAASRYPMALSHDQLLPERLGRVNENTNTPLYAIFLTGLIILGALFLDVKMLAKAASAVLILTYIFSCLAVLIMRESRLQNYRPSFQSPLYPWVQIIGILGFGAFLLEMGWQILGICFLLILGGLFVYWFYGRIQESREFALLHLIERITARELTAHSLETELKEIVRERDEIAKDRFDHLIEDSVVLDIKESMTADGLFHRVAQELSARLGMPPQTIVGLLAQREQESTTVISPSLAIPHIIIEGEKKFDVLIVRCREGIEFSEENPAVHVVFVLIGTRDERPFHLRALAAICQIVQHRNFEKDWMAAKTKEALRDIVLLGERRRHDH